MNIYLDIDGVLLADMGVAAPHADEFLQAVLKKYPESTYWLTTHCWRGENRTIEVLKDALQPDTVALLHKIKPTEWGEAKTDAIDFSQPFLWFDDDLYPEEKVALVKHSALDNHVMVNLYKNPNQLKEIIKKYF